MKPEVKCEDCKMKTQHPNMRFTCEHPKAKYYTAMIERRRGNCGPDGKLFEPKEKE